MRLPTDVLPRALALGLTVLLSACGRGGNDTVMPLASAADTPAPLRNGPAADYPVILGEPYSINGTLYTPVDTMNYDEVGYAVSDEAGGYGVTAAHRTLPLPSYVEITSLETGKTILVRVERRGPMTGNGLVALSSGAQAQLGVADGAPIRIRRVNALEEDRAKLRIGEAAPLRMDTPKSLLAVMKRKLPENGAASLALAAQPSAPPRSAAPPSAATKPAGGNFQQAFDPAQKGSGQQAAKAYPLTPLAGKGASPVSSSAPKPAAAAKPAPAAAAKGGFVIQAGAFSNKANAEKLAKSIDGYIEQSGKYYRVKKGPFVNRGQAEAALAKIKAAGYRDARINSAG